MTQKWEIPWYEDLGCVQFAHEILDLQKEARAAARLRKELEELQTKYNTLLDERIEHGNKMHGMVIRAILHVAKDGEEKVRDLAGAMVGDDAQEADGDATPEAAPEEA